MITLRQVFLAFGCRVIPAIVLAFSPPLVASAQDDAQKAGQPQKSEKEQALADLKKKLDEIHEKAATAREQKDFAQAEQLRLQRLVVLKESKADSPWTAGYKTLVEADDLIKKMKYQKACDQLRAAWEPFETPPAGDRVFGDLAMKLFEATQASLAVYTDATEATGVSSKYLREAVQMAADEDPCQVEALAADAFLTDPNPDEKFQPAELRKSLRERNKRLIDISFSKDRDEPPLPWHAPAEFLKAESSSFVLDDLNYYERFLDPRRRLSGRDRHGEPFSVVMGGALLIVAPDGNGPKRPCVAEYLPQENRWLRLRPMILSVGPLATRALEWQVDERKLTQEITVIAQDADEERRRLMRMEILKTADGLQSTPGPQAKPKIREKVKKHIETMLGWIKKPPQGQPAPTLDQVLSMVSQGYHNYAAKFPDDADAASAAIEQLEKIKSEWENFSRLRNAVSQWSGSQDLAAGPTSPAALQNMLDLLSRDDPAQLEAAKLEAEAEAQAEAESRAAEEAKVRAEAKAKAEGAKKKADEQPADKESWEQDKDTESKDDDAKKDGPKKQKQDKKTKRPVTKPNDNEKKPVARNEADNKKAPDRQQADQPEDSDAKTPAADQPSAATPKPKTPVPASRLRAAELRSRLAECIQQYELLNKYRMMEVYRRQLEEMLEAASKVPPVGADQGVSEQRRDARRREALNRCKRGVAKYVAAVDACRKKQMTKDPSGQDKTVAYYLITLGTLRDTRDALKSISEALSQLGVYERYAEFIDGFWQTCNDIETPASLERDLVSSAQGAAKRIHAWTIGQTRWSIYEFPVGLNSAKLANLIDYSRRVSFDIDLLKEAAEAHAAADKNPAKPRTIPLRVGTTTEANNPLVELERGQPVLPLLRDPKNPIVTLLLAVEIQADPNFHPDGFRDQQGAEFLWLEEGGGRFKAFLNTSVADAGEMVVEYRGVKGHVPLTIPTERFAKSRYLRDYRGNRIVRDGGTGMPDNVSKFFKITSSSGVELTDRSVNYANQDWMDLDRNIMNSFLPNLLLHAPSLPAWRLYRQEFQRVAPAPDWKWTVPRWAYTLGSDSQ